MEFNLSGLGFFTFFCQLMLGVSYASLPSEVYWQTMLPNTQMPKAIRDILRPRHDGSTSFHVTEDSTNSHSGDKALVYLTARAKAPVFTSTGEQGQDDLNVANFFLEKELHPGSKMKLHFTKITNGSTFLPREVAESIPFSSTKLPDILNLFSVKPESPEAKIIKETIGVCEEPSNVEGEDNYCATSLESIIDFSTSVLGQKVEALSTEVETGTQDYKIEAGVVEMVGDKALSCHKQKYPYAVFYCHATLRTRTYTVPLVDAKGTKSKAVAICHKDTSEWNPKHLSFQVLKVKPGTVPICHFLPNDHIVWVAN
ncbi:hypothetical protein L1049_018381 [Liquidambar formosana]|uniref:BURP domain-containing protein n=1 Tax=Liquidambar formosana TaxID=63359 RepID=A0AAP0RA69_LIQFO